VTVLSLGQILSGVGLGAGVSIGALLVAAVGGDEALSGLAATAGTLGAALFAIPLARFAGRRGRRPALSTGALVAVVGAAGAILSSAAGSLVGLLLALVVLGAGNAVNLQARFAATDLAEPAHRGRDLSIVVWTTTIGVVVGPNLIEPGQAIGRAFGLPDLTGSFLITAACQVAAAVLYLTTLRPDPLLTAAIRARQTASADHAVSADRTGPADQSVDTSDADPNQGTRRSLVVSLRSAGPRARAAIAVVALSHATMVSVMAMTPVHLSHSGSSLSVIGLTISLHTLGMFGLSPVFGWLSDRIGRRTIVLTGQGLLAMSLGIGWAWSSSPAAVTGALILLGLGWSASTIAGSALLAGATSAGDRPSVQGLSDTAMNLAGALGGALAGLVLSAVGYAGLNAVALLLVAAATVLSVGLRPLTR